MLFLNAFLRLGLELPGAELCPGLSLDGGGRLLPLPLPRSLLPLLPLQPGDTIQLFKNPNNDLIFFLAVTKNRAWLKGGLQVW